VHEDPVTKSKRVTDINGTVVSTVELDPWGADTNRSSNAAFQPHKYTTYESDGNGSDEAMFRRYNRWHSRFDRPNPYDGSYNMGDPQSFNRYAYVSNDPVNFTDPSGLLMSLGCGPGTVAVQDGNGNTHCVPGGVVTVRDRGSAINTLVYLSSLGGSPTIRTGIGFTGGGGGGGRGGPQNATPATPTDCQRFVSLVQGIANSASSVEDFLNTLARTFTGADNSSINEMQAHANRSLRGLPGRVEFGPSNGANGGFKQDFRDPSNQARHFVGGFIAVARVGLYGYYSMQERENSQNSDDAADRRLNGLSAAFASRFLYEPLTPDLGSIRADFANSLRRDLCD
jgi:RHS repeat-associated protein